MIHDLFKIGIYAEQLPLNNEELRKYCFDIKQKQDGVKISNRGGFHSENLNKNDANIKELMEADFFTCKFIFSKKLLTVK